MKVNINTDHKDDNLLKPWIGLVLYVSDQNGANVHLTKEPEPRYGLTWDLREERFILIEDVLLKIE